MMETVPEGALMRRAAYGLAAHVRGWLGSTYGRRVTLLVGAGDNGGDALWAGVELRRRGAVVTAVLLVPDRAHPAGLAALRAARGRVVDGGSDGAVDAVRGADVVIDGIVGISGKPGLRDPAPALVAAADDAGVPIVACDLPSGVGTDTGETDGPCVRAAFTVTFGARKPVHALAAPLCGPVRLVDFGLGPFLPEPHAYLLARRRRRRPLAGTRAVRRQVHPGRRRDRRRLGHLPGRGRARGGRRRAVHLRDGPVRRVGRRRGATALAGDRGHRRHHRRRADAGLGRRARHRHRVARPGPAGGGARPRGAAVHRRGRDHAAGTARRPARPIRGRPSCSPRTPGVRADRGRCRHRPGRATRRAAADLGVTVLLKGNATVVADPDGRVLVDPADDSWAATAGSGDVLTGMTGALLAAGLDPWWAAGCATFVHARAADLAASGGGPASPTRRPGATAPAPASRCRRRSRDALRAVGRRRLTLSRGAREVGPGCDDAPRVRPGSPARAPRRSSTSTPSGTTSTCCRRGPPGAALMAVVKADGYGHGAVAVGRAALAAGATWLGVVHAGGGAGPARGGHHRARAVLAAPARTTTSPRPSRRASTSRSSSREHLAAVLAGARPPAARRGCTSRPTPASSRNGAPPRSGPTCSTTRPRPSPTGEAEVVAVWSHLAHADDPRPPHARRPGRAR